MKVKIISAEYQEKTDLIFFTLQKIGAEEIQTYCWPSRDYLEHLDISVESIDPEQLHKHCKDMVDKKINFEILGKPINVEPKIDLQRKRDVENEIEDLKKQAEIICDDVISAAKKIQNID